MQFMILVKNRMKNKQNEFIRFTRGVDCLEIKNMSILSYLMLCSLDINIRCW